MKGSFGDGLSLHTLITFLSLNSNSKRCALLYVFQISFMHALDDVLLSNLSSSFNVDVDAPASYSSSQKFMDSCP
jgi:hypothetical protein